MFPKAKEFYEYLWKYVDHFGLKKYIRFNCEIKEIDCCDKDAVDRVYTVTW